MRDAPAREGRSDLSIVNPPIVDGPIVNRPIVNRPLVNPPIVNPHSAQALVVAADCGYSTMTWWTATVRLLVSVAGRRPALVTHRCVVERGKDLIDGFSIPVDVDRDDPTRLAIRWDEVPTISERIAGRDPAILDPEGSWRRTRHAETGGRRRPGEPPWGGGRMAGWPPSDPLPNGRQPGSAWVVGHSADPRPHMVGDEFTPSPDYAYGGKVSAGPRAYVGWLLVCVLPEYSERFATYLRTSIRPAYFAPVLPVGINPRDPNDLEIMWSYAPVR